MINSNIYIDSYLKVSNLIPNLDKLKNKNIFITGATGLLGSAFVDFFLILNEHLDYNIKIFAGARNLDKFEKKYEKFLNSKYLNFVSYDLNQEIALSVQVDFIIHTASTTQPKDYVSNPKETLLNGINGVLNLINYIKFTNYTSKLLYISSSEVYGTVLTDIPITEKNLPQLDSQNIRSSYALSKICGELLLNIELNFGLKFNISRPGHVYGPLLNKNDNRAYAEFIKTAKRGENILLRSSGKDLRSYIYIIDCVSANITILLNGENGNIYNISADIGNISIRDFSKIISNEFHVSLDISIESKNIDYFNPMKNALLNNKKLKDLGWNYMFTVTEAVKNIKEIESVENNV